MHDVELLLFQQEMTQYINKIRLLKFQFSQPIEMNKQQALQQLHEQWQPLQQQYDRLICFGYEQRKEIEAIQKVLGKLCEETIETQQWKPVILLQKLEQIVETLSNSMHIKTRKDAFLVDSWTKWLKRFEKISVFYILRTYFLKNYAKQNYRFVDCWIVLHTLLAIAFVFIANLEQVATEVKYGLLIYGCLRMFEILIYQLNVILVHPYNHQNYALNSYRRMTIALIHNFIEIIFWFAGTFVTLQFISDTSVPRAVYTSFTHMVTYSMELDDGKWTLLAIFILQFQAAIGVFMTVLSLARFVSLFPQPASLDPKEQEANEVRHALLLQELTLLKATVESNRLRIVEIEKNEEQTTSEYVSVD